MLVHRNRIKAGKNLWIGVEKELGEKHTTTRNSMIYIGIIMDLRWCVLVPSSSLGSHHRGNSGISTLLDRSLKGSGAQLEMLMAF